MKGMNTMKKIFMSLICIFSILINYNFVYGYEVSDHLVSNNRDIVISRVYIFDEDTIEERQVIRLDNDLIFLNLIIYPNNTYIATIKDDKGRTRELTGRYSFDSFKVIAEEYTSSLSRGKKDIAGKQYKHQKIGVNSFTVDREEVLNLGNFAIDVVVSVLANLNAGSTAYVAMVSRYILNSLMSGEPDYVEVDVTTYEVLLTYDNSYYTHCYHSVIKAYKYGKLINTTKDYTQVVGG